MFITFNIVIFMILEFSSVELNDLKENDLRILENLIKSIHKETKNHEKSNRVSFEKYSGYNENNKTTTPLGIPVLSHFLTQGQYLRTTDNKVLRGKSSESSQSLNKEQDSHENQTLPHILTEEIIDITAENGTIVVQDKNYMRQEKAEIKCLEACEEAYKDVCGSNNCKFRMRQKFQKSCVTACGNQF